MSEWISVKDGLPKAETPVLVCTDKGFVWAAERIGDTFFLDNDSWTEKITHWMPLPKLPKEG